MTLKIPEDAVVQPLGADDDTLTITGNHTGLVAKGTMVMTHRIAVDFAGSNNSFTEEKERFRHYQHR